MRFRDRREAGWHLARLLERYRAEDPIVLALPRGGVPVGYEVARALDAPLDVVVARKLGAPQCPEYAIGAIAEGGAVFLDPAGLLAAGLEGEALAAVAEREAIELARRVRRYRGRRPFPAIAGRTAILVDDGVATGRTARAAVQAVRQLRPRRLVLAAPVVAAVTAPALRAEVDDLVHVLAPEDFTAVGLWYEQFEPTTDAEVVALLARARRERAARARRGGAGPDAPAGEEDPPEVVAPAAAPRGGGAS